MEALEAMVSNSKRQTLQKAKSGKLTKGNISLISFKDETLEEGEVMLQH
jgi:hypothetical protein